MTCSYFSPYHTLSVDHRDQWLECARAAFASMDSAEKGHITSSQLVSLLSTKLPAEEVEHAVEDALMEAGCGGELCFPASPSCVTQCKDKHATALPGSAPYLSALQFWHVQLSS